LFSCYQLLLSAGLLLFLVYLVFEGVAGAPVAVNPLDEVSALARLFNVVCADQGHDGKIHEYFGLVDP